MGSAFEVGFSSRRDAGRLLARELRTSGLLDDDERVVVVGLARGGVEVAAEVASALAAPLEALAVRKVGHLWQPEYGIGAVAPGGVAYVRAPDGLTATEVAAAVARAAAESDALDETLHAHHIPVPMARTACVLVDDGLATGGTMVAAVRWARAQGAAKVIVAVPVGASQTVRRLEQEDDVDGVLCLLQPLDFRAVGSWYWDFRQTSDEDVVALLSASLAWGAERTRDEEMDIGDALLHADLAVPRRPDGWVVFAHGSGSGRHSPRNVAVASQLSRAGIATLLFDLLTPDEERDRANVFDIALLARRLVAATRWLSARPDAHGLPIGYFGASTGAAAALVAAAQLGDEIAAVVSRGGRPDLALDALEAVRAPTLLVVGGDDTVVLGLNEEAARRLTCPHALEVVPGATHLFEQPRALERVAALAASCFTTQFSEDRARSRAAL